MGFDLASILSDATAGAGVFQQLAVSTTENTKAQQDITDVMVEQAHTAQSAAEEIASVQGQAKLKTQQTNLRVANTMGTNADDSGWLIGQMGKRVIEADTAAQAHLEDIQAKQGVSFFDNPVGYLYAQATVGGDIEAYNTEVRKSDLAKDTAAKLESMSQTSFLTQNAIEQSVTEGTIKANTILQGYKYANDANNAALQGLRTNLAGMTAAAGATAQSIDMKFKGFSAVNAQAQLGIAQAGLELRQKEFNLSQEAKKNKLNEDSFTLKLIDQGMFSMTGQNIPDETKGKELLMLYRAGQPDVVRYLNSGLASYTAGKPVLSNSPAEAADMFAANAVKNIPQAQQDVGQWLVGQRQEFGKQLQAGKFAGVEPKDKAAVGKEFSEFIRKNAVGLASTGQGLYAPAAIETTVKANPNLAQLPVYQKVLAPMLAAGVKLDNPDLVMGAISKAVTKGDLSYNDALNISTIYSGGIEINNAARNWTNAGLPIGTGYVTNLHSPDAMSAGPVAVTDKTAVGRFINRSLAYQTLRAPNEYRR